MYLDCPIVDCLFLFLLQKRFISKLEFQDFLKSKKLSIDLRGEEVRDPGNVEKNIEFFLKLQFDLITILQGCSMTDFPQSGNSSNSPAFAAALQRAQLIASKIKPDGSAGPPPQIAGGLNTFQAFLNLNGATFCH